MDFEPCDYTPREIAAALRDRSLDPDLTADIDRCLPRLRREHRLLLADWALGYSVREAKRRWQLPGKREVILHAALYSLYLYVNGKVV